MGATEIVRRTLARRAGVTLKEVDTLVGQLEANWQALTPQQEVHVSEANSLKVSWQLGRASGGVWVHHA